MRSPLLIPVLFLAQHSGPALGKEAAAPLSAQDALASQASAVAPSDPPASALGPEAIIPEDAPRRLRGGGMVSYPSKWNGKVHVKQRGRVRSLYLGRRMDIVHTRLDLDRPARLISPYQKCLLAGFGLLGRGGQEIRRVAMIGLGGGAITRFFHEKRPNWVFHSVEIDPVVVAVARAFFGVKDTPGYRSYAMDGRRFIEQAVVPYDLVIIDAFNADAAVPKTLASQEFFRIVRQKLAPGGLLAVNVLVHSRRVYASLVKTLSTAFPTVLRMPLHSFGSRNSLLLASARTDLKLDRETLRARARRVEADFGVRFGLDRCVAVIGADRLPMGGASLILDPVGGPGKP